MQPPFCLAKPCDDHLNYLRTMFIKCLYYFNQQQAQQQQQK